MASIRRRLDAARPGGDEGRRHPPPVRSARPGRRRRSGRRRARGDGSVRALRRRPAARRPLPRQPGRLDRPRATRSPATRRSSSRRERRPRRAAAARRTRSTCCASANRRDRCRAEDRGTPMPRRVQRQTRLERFVPRRRRAGSSADEAGLSARRFLVLQQPPHHLARARLRQRVDELRRSWAPCRPPCARAPRR